MKVLLLVSLWLFADVSFQHRQKQVCPQFNINGTVLHNAFRGIYASDPNLGCFLNCFMVEKKFTFVNRTVNVEHLRTKITAKVNQTEANRLLNLCVTKTGTENCTYGIDAFRCLQPFLNLTRPIHCKGKRIV
ncbi:hypothetical protein FQR65_LT14267 [Abscondita terminalis]|nr:hypothetical protein FQR65_LT14267 [Abscondita terminalis]